MHWAGFWAWGLSSLSKPGLNRPWIASSGESQEDVHHTRPPTTRWGGPGHTPSEVRSVLAQSEGHSACHAACCARGRLRRLGLGGGGLLPLAGLLE